MEAVAVADIGPDAGRGQRVVVAAALRKKARSGAVGRADAGQTERMLSLPVAYRLSLPSSPCGRKRGRERREGMTRGKR